MAGPVEQQGESHREVRKKRNWASNKRRMPNFYSIDQKVIVVYYRLGLILLHSEMAGTMLRVTSSSRILHRCS